MYKQRRVPSVIFVKLGTGLDRSRFQDNRHIKVVRLSALRTGRLTPHFRYRLSQPQA
jgi:hypothetical protein